MIYRLIDVKPFFRNTKGTRRHYFTVPNNLLFKPPYSGLKTRNSRCLLYDILTILSLKNEACETIEKGVWTVCEADIERVLNSGKGGMKGVCMTTLVNLGILEVVENTNEISDRSEIVCHDSSHNRVIRSLKDNTKIRNRTDMVTHVTEDKNRLVVDALKDYPLKQGLDAAANWASDHISIHDVPRLEKSVKNYANSCQSKKTEDQFKILPINFVQKRWPEFEKISVPGISDDIANLRKENAERLGLGWS